MLLGARVYLSLLGISNWLLALHLNILFIPQLTTAGVSKGLGPSPLDLLTPC